MLSPIRTGAPGANIKLVEAIQFGCAVLATPLSADGFEGFLEPGRDLLTFTTSEELLDLLLSTLGDERLLQELRANARKATESYFNQAYFNRIIREDVEAILASPRAARPR